MASSSPPNKGKRAPKRTAQDWLRLQPVFDQLVQQYKTPAYVANDPIQIPYRYQHDAQACELVAFISALFSYGRRDAIIATLSQLFQIVGEHPMDFLQAFNPKRDQRLFQHFIYRFNKGSDLTFLLTRLKWAYQEYESLENLFLESLQDAQQAKRTSKRTETSVPDSKLKIGIAAFTDRLLGTDAPPSYGLKFLFAHPDRGGACKRFNMFLRWVVRHDADPAERVDLGLWKHALQPSDLLVPLDTHILKMNQKLGLTQRTDGSWRTAEAVTDIFRLLCPDDPIKYDYALFGFSLDKRAPQEILQELEPSRNRQVLLI